MVDTREQLPYSESEPGPFGRLEHTPFVRAKLDSGDYSILGYEHEVAIERKRPSELFSCFTTERARFRREFERLAGYRFAAVVIEGHIEDVSIRYNTWQADGESQIGKVSPSLVINSLISWSIRFGVHIIFAGTRELAQTYTYRALEKFASMLERESDLAASAASSAADLRSLGASLAPGAGTAGTTGEGSTPAADADPPPW